MIVEWSQSKNPEVILQVLSVDILLETAVCIALNIGILFYIITLAALWKVNWPCKACMQGQSVKAIE